MTITISNISQVIVFVNTLTNIFLVNYLTTYILRDILTLLCIKKKRKYGYSVVQDVDTSGFHAIPIENHEYAQILNAIAPIGKNRARVSKRKLFKVNKLKQWLSIVVDRLEIMGDGGVVWLQKQG